MRRIFGWSLFAFVMIWDFDAVRIHIMAHSWLTLCYVLIFVVGHAIDLLTMQSITLQINTEAQ